MSFLFETAQTLRDSTEKHDTIMWFYRHMGIMPGRGSKVLIRGFRKYIDERDYKNVLHKSNVSNELILELPRILNNQLSATRLQVAAPIMELVGANGERESLLNDAWHDSMWALNSSYW